MKITTAFAALSLAVTPTVLLAQAPSPGATPPPAQPPSNESRTPGPSSDVPVAASPVVTDPARFAELAASAGEFEIRSGELALQKSRNAEVRAFAKEMVDDHIAAAESLAAAAQDDSVELPEALLPGDDDAMKGLEAASEFDGAYIDAQVAAHEQAVALFEGFSAGGPEDALKTFAMETLPKLQDHLERIKALTEV